MGHSIQAIIANPTAVVGVRGALPGLASAPLHQGFVAFPVEADDVDAPVASGAASSADGFRILTGPFRDFLRELSRLGPLAYVETDYFAGSGGQGAAAYSAGTALMEPGWARRGPIDRALKRIGGRRRLLGDRFLALGLANYRSNDTLRAAAGGPRGDAEGSG